jgi:hypothetical protein
MALFMTTRPSPSGVLVVVAFAILSLITSIRSLCAVKPVDDILKLSNIPIVYLGRYPTQLL